MQTQIIHKWSHKNYNNNAVQKDDNVNFFMNDN
jgi:hypothetical protein